MKIVRKLLVVFLLTVIVSSMSTAGVYAVNIDYSSEGHTHRFMISTFAIYTDCGPDEHINNYIRKRSCVLCDYEEVIESGYYFDSHTFNVIDEHVGKTHYYSEICEFCEHVKYLGSYPCSGNPCIKPHSIIKVFTQ